MMFYIMLPNDKEEDAIPVGELSFNTFYTEIGYWMIKKQILDENKEFIEKAIIISERAITYSIQEFLDMLNNQNVGLA